MSMSCAVVPSLAPAPSSRAQPECQASRNATAQPSANQPPEHHGLHTEMGQESYDQEERQPARQTQQSKSIRQRRNGCMDEWMEDGWPGRGLDWQADGI